MFTDAEVVHSMVHEDVDFFMFDTSLRNCQHLIPHATFFAVIAAQDHKLLTDASAIICGLSRRLPPNVVFHTLGSVTIRRTRLSRASSGTLHRNSKVSGWERSQSANFKAEFRRMASSFNNSLSGNSSFTHGLNALAVEVREYRAWFFEQSRPEVCS